MSPRPSSPLASPSTLTRFLTLAAAVGGSFGVAVSACGGATSQDVLGSSSGSNGTTSGGASGTTSGGTSGTSGASGGTSGTTSGGTSGASGSVDASTGCPPETEPNDGADEANTIAPTLCGAILNNESDFLTFQLKPTSTSLQIKFDGKVTLKVEAGGNSVTLGGASSAKVPFVKNGRYIIEIKASERAASVPWRVDIIEL